MPDYRKVHYRFDVRDAREELHRLSEEPDERAILKFEAVLEFLFQQTQQHVHIITGSLKGSGTRESDHRRGRWRARIRYGGRSTGPISPVKYATYEHERGGLHDFMAPLDEADPMWRDVIIDWMRGER